MARPFKKAIFIFLGLVFTLAVFGGGFLLGQIKTEPQIIFSVSNSDLGQAPAIDFSLFWRTWAVLQEKFVNAGRMEPQKMIYGAIEGMVKSLGDPYTVFFPPQEAKRFEEDVKGSFEGVGMEIDKKNDQIVVVSPLEGTPAQRAGLKAGDKILAINGTSTADMTTDEAVKIIRGPKGTEVVLTISRNSWAKAKDIKIVRDVIKVPSLKLEFKDYNNQKIAYLRLYQFSEAASGEFSKAAADILNSPAKKIILDLRNDPGGYLEVAQYIAGWFLDAGQTVTIEDFGGKKEQNIYKARGPAALSAYPVAVLINQGSASASEILAGALRDNRGVVLIGEKSFGKGSVQELEKLEDGSSLKITVAKWLTPKGDSISEVGLEPDNKVEMTDKDIEASKDPQLDKALEIISQIK